MEKGNTYVGMDVHKKNIVVTMLRPGTKDGIDWRLANEPRAVRRLARKLKREGEGTVICAYEAGPCGYALQRQLVKEKIQCLVVAPSLIPRKPGLHIKTDRRDAKKIAEMLRAGLLTEVHPPSPEEEALRDLCRCRYDARADQMRARLRLSHFLLRRGRVYREGKHWTLRHRAWLRSLRFEYAAEQAVFEDYLQAVGLIEERLRGLQQALEELALSEPYAERVGWLRCFRGIDTLTAITILAELHSFGRFGSARQLMAFLGLVPKEHSSGPSTRRGRITKAGNTHVRRALVESAWHYRHRPAVGVQLRRRRQGQPSAIVALADRAQRRLHRRWCRLVFGSGKPTPKATTAIARELVGFLWAVLYLYPQQQEAEAQEVA